MDQGQRSALYQQLAKLIPSQVDAVAVIIGMPAEHQPASGLSAAERAKLMVDWAAQNATRLKGLQEAVEAQAGLPPSREKVQTPAATKDPFPPALSVVKYSELQQRARQTNQRLLQLAEKLNIQSMAARGRRFAEALNAGPYRVVVVGRSRAGKSTLLNALLGRDLCPVQSDLTTAVPVVVEPGLPEFARVRYQGGQFKDLDGPISAPSLAPYVDQAINVGNQKGIEEIRVRLANQSPDLGIAFIDVPGFDDPNGAIWPAAKKELERAHALILVVDVSTARDGGLALDRETIGHLKSATQRETPVFIVGNKADRLDDEEERQSTVKRLQKQLAQYQLQAPLVAGPFLIEAKKTRAAQVAGRALPSSFNEFLSILWLRLWGERHRPAPPVCNIPATPAGRSGDGDPLSGAGRR
jgi:small GTP-binding protein